MDGPLDPAPQSNLEPTETAESATESALRAEVADLRRRLRFYEGFDRIIQENVSRAGDLLRMADEERSRAARDAIAVREEAERTAQRQRSLLIGLAAEVQALSRRILAAIDEGAADEPAAVATIALSDALLEREALIDAPTQTPSAADAVAKETASELAPQPSVGDLSASDAARNANGSAAPRSMTVIVHGVPDARAALSLQRHLADLAGGGTVLAREFMDGIARFEVTGKAISFDDLRRWDGGGELRPVHLQPDVVEVAAPGVLPL